MNLDDAADELRRATEALRRETRELRKRHLREWLDTDPGLRLGFIELSPELKALSRHVAKLERLAIGFRTNMAPDHCP